MIIINTCQLLTFQVEIGSPWVTIGNSLTLSELGPYTDSQPISGGSGTVLASILVADA